MADRIVAFAGSLRRGSFNRALIHAAQELAPHGMAIDLVEIAKLPFYNADVEAQGDPPSVAIFKASLREADGLLIATPEYNDGIPGVLTTAIDWGSRLPGRAPLWSPLRTSGSTRISGSPMKALAGCWRSSSSDSAGGSRGSELPLRPSGNTLID